MDKEERDRHGIQRGSWKGDKGTRDRGQRGDKGLKGVRGPWHKGKMDRSG